MFYLELTEIDDGSSSSSSKSSIVEVVVVVEVVEVQVVVVVVIEEVVLFTMILKCYFMKLLCDSARGTMSTHQSIS